jgi:hypothetical protein
MAQAGPAGTRLWSQPAPAARPDLAHCASWPILLGLLAVDDLLATASAALGATLTDPHDLGGSERSAVLRCRVAGGGTVVVKNYPGTAEGADSFAAEAAGFALAAQAGAGPRLLATSPPARLVVMSDLGLAPSLADVLLTGSAAAAEAALLDWVRACGELAAVTAGQQPELAALLAAHRVAPAADGAEPAADGAEPAADGSEHWLERRIFQIPAILGEPSLPAPAGLAADLAEVAGIVRPGQPEVFSPGDICPDNNLLTAGGVRFVDFESAEFHSAFLDAAYLRKPFSTCWCVFRLPERISLPAEAAYRDRVCRAFPDLATDACWLPGVRRAMAAWTLHAMSYLLDRSMAADKSMIDDDRAAPTARQLLRYRWRRLLGELEPAGELQSLSALARGLLTATEHWQVPELPLYPAFR